MKSTDDSFRRFPSFDLEHYLEEQGVEFRTHDADDHVELAFNCPKCRERGEEREDTRGRLWINKIDGKFNCYNCSWAGDLRRLVSHYSNTSYDGALKILRGGLLDPLEHLNFSLFHEKIDMDDEDEGAVLREIDFPYGFEPFEDGESPEVFFDYLERRGVSLDYAVENGWGWSNYGYTANRIIVPTYMDDLLVFWQARDILNEIHPGYGTKEYRKVLNPRGVSARSVLYGFDMARDSEEIILCEGFMDCVKAGPGSVATNGKHLHPAQLEWLTKTKAKSIVMLWDEDAYTDHKYYRTGPKKGGLKRDCSVEIAAKMLIDYFDVRYVRLPDGKDAGDMDPAELRKLITP